jgi:hypothetical protein
MEEIMSKFKDKKPIIKYMQTEVSHRVDGMWAAYAVLTWADLDLVSPDETFAAIAMDQPYRNPLKWVCVGTSPTRQGAIDLAVAKKREVLSRTGSQLNSMVSPLEEEVSSLIDVAVTIAGSVALDKHNQQLKSEGIGGYG